MNSTLFEQFLGPSATRFQLPTLIEEENDELCPLVNIKYCRINRTRKVLLGIKKIQFNIAIVLLHMLTLRSLFLHSIH